MHEAPLMPFRIFRPVSAVARIFLAVLLRGRFFHNFRASSSRFFTVFIDRIHPHGERLCVDATKSARTLAWYRSRTRRLAASTGNHNYSFAEGKLRVFDAPAFSFDFQPHLKTKRFAQPVDRFRGVIVKDCRRDPRPTLRWFIHRANPQ